MLPLSLTRCAHFKSVLGILIFNILGAGSGSQWRHGNSNGAVSVFQWSQIHITSTMSRVPDPHQSDKSATKDPQQSENSDPDPHQHEKKDPDPPQRDADFQQCLQCGHNDHRLLLTTATTVTKILDLLDRGKILCC
jgi:hypothetical protein